MKKKLLSILLVLSLMLALVPAAFAADAASGTCGAEGDGSNVTWTIDKNGVLTVTGTGAITSDGMKIQQLQYRTDVYHAVIGEGITDMGALRFWGYTSLISVSFPDTITRLEKVCSNCLELTSVRLPARLESLVNAFAWCSSLTTIALPDTLKTISGSFSSCQGLTEVVVPEGVTTLGEGTFDHCTSLVRVTLPSTLRQIESYCFSECRALRSVSIPEGVTKLESDTFYNCTALESVSLPASLTSVGYLSFHGARNVKYVCYAGTRAQWKEISVSVNPDTGRPAVLFPAAKLCYEHPEHVFDALTDTPTTCTDNGRITGTCTVCGYRMDTELPAYGHAWNAGTVLAEPDGVHCGVVAHACLRCGGTGYELLPPEVMAYEQFTDVDPELWSYEGIQYCVALGFMSGVSETTFSPGTVTTRAQLVQVLYNFVGQPDVTGVTTPFTDTPADWYQAAIAWAYETGVVDGTSPTTFAPNESVTREQIAVLLMRFLTNVCGVERTWTPDDLSGFADGSSVSGWARAGMADAVALGLFGGTQDDNGQVWLRPRAGATRAETAALLQRMCTNVLGIA